MKRFQLLAFMVLCLPWMARAGDARPNILFIYTDDQRYDALSVVQREQGEGGRFPWFRTPHLDRLAAEGVRFRNAFVVSSLCAPSRAVFLTGRYNHLNGIASNFRPFPIHNVTHATLLGAAGYTTAYIGKWHMDSQRERPGFDYHASYIGHARYEDPIFIVNGQDTPRQGWIDDLATDDAIEFMRRQKGASKPWSMVLGFKSPHGPFEPPPRAQDRFAGEWARPVPNLATPTPYLGASQTSAASPPDTSAGKTPVNLNYFRCISAVDDCVGRLLEALDEFGMARNTVVIYASDNGFYLGEHGLGDKRSAYDESLRIPFLVRYPALGPAARGRVVNEMVLNLDLAQTVLDLAGVPAPQTMQGQSWRPLLVGERVNWRQSWFYEYFAEKQRNSRVPDITAVRTTDAKLIRYPGHEDWTELFDLRTDPFETRNLYRDPSQAELRERLESEHDRWAKIVGYRVPDYVDRPEGYGQPGWPDLAVNTKPEIRLNYLFDQDQANQITDASGKNHHGIAHGTQLATGRPGRRARGFDGTSYIEVPKAPGLNPAGIPWTIEAVVKSQHPDGVILARGGKSNGYALWLQEGRPALSVVIGGKPVIIAAAQPVSDWVVITAHITPQHQAILFVDGRTVAHGDLPDFIERDPADGMQIGADLGSPVIEPTPRKFTGLIERVTLSSGAPPFQPK